MNVLQIAKPYQWNGGRVEGWTFNTKEHIEAFAAEVIAQSQAENMAKIAMLVDCVKRCENVLRYRVNPHGHTQMEKGGNTQEWTKAIHCIESSLPTAKADADKYTQQVRDEAYEKSAVMFETTHCTLLPSGIEVAGAIRKLKGTKP
jgi:hypothetical protein